MRFSILTIFLLVTLSGCKSASRVETAMVPDWAHGPWKPQTQSTQWVRMPTDDELKTIKNPTAILAQLEMLDHAKLTFSPKDVAFTFDQDSKYNFSLRYRVESIQADSVTIVVERTGELWTLERRSEETSVDLEFGSSVQRAKVVMIKSE